MEKLKLFATRLSQENKNVVLLIWSFSCDKESFEKFIIVKSYDNKEFEIIGTEKRISGINREFNYLFVDENIHYANNQYSIRYLTKGKHSTMISISNTVTITIDERIDRSKKEKRAQISKIKSTRDLELIVA